MHVESLAEISRWALKIVDACGLTLLILSIEGTNALRVCCAVCNPVHHEKAMFACVLGSGVAIRSKCPRELSRVNKSENMLIGGEG